MRQMSAVVIRNVRNSNRIALNLEHVFFFFFKTDLKKKQQQKLAMQIIEVYFLNF